MSGHKFYRLNFVNISVVSVWPTYHTRCQSCLSRLVQVLYAASLPESVMTSQMAMFMGPEWGPTGADRTQVDPILAPWTLLSGLLSVEILWINCREVVMKIQICHSRKCILSTTQYWSFSLGLDMLTKTLMYNIILQLWVLSPFPMLGHFS